MQDERNLLDVLRAELAFLESGGYSNRACFPWRPNFVFEDSLTCLNFGAKEVRRPCSECLLMQFVPDDRTKLAYPCRQMPLTPKGESVAHFYECGTESELKTALEQWLQRKIGNWKREKASRRGSHSGLDSTARARICDWVVR